MFLAATATTVHTSGVNWASVTTIIGGSVATMSIIIGLFARWIANRIAGAINTFRIDVISVMDTRLTRVETKMDTLRRRQVRDDD